MKFFGGTFESGGGICRETLAIFFCFLFRLYFELLVNREESAMVYIFIQIALQCTSCDGLIPGLHGHRGCFFFFGGGGDDRRCGCA